MKKIKFLATLSALTLLGATPLLGKTIEVKGEGTSLNNLQFEDSYNLGDVISVSKNGQLVAGDKVEKITSSYLTYPNGKIISSDNYKLDSYGSYKLSLIGESNLTYIKEFKVNKSYYSYGNKSSVDYGALNKSFSTAGYPNGLKVNLTEGDTFSYAKPIQLGATKYQKLIAWNVDDYSRNPTVHSISVRLTDAYNPNNYFTITNSKGSYWYENYFSASYNGGRSVGLTANDAGAIVIGSSAFSLSTTGGTALTGNDAVSRNYNNITYYLDSSDATKWKIYGANDSAKETRLITEFNNPSIYSNSFPGFKTGLAYLSVTASGFSGVETAPIQIGCIGETKGEDLIPMDAYQDTIKPIIDVNAKKEAMVKGGVAITVPEAKGYDESGLASDVRYSVYYGYDSSNKKLISVKNNSFTPDEFGIYTVLYEVKDVYGNVSQERIDLYVSSFGETGIDFSIKEFGALKAGTSIKFDNFTAVSLNDDCVTEIDLLQPNGVSKTLSSTESYLLEASGTYKATYRYKDSFYSGSKEYTFDVSGSDQAVFETENIPLPNYFMKNGSYTLDIPKAYSFGTTGMKEDNVDFFVKFDDGSYQKANPKDLTITGNKFVSFKFNPSTNLANVVETASYPIVDTGFDGRTVNLTKYFVGDFTGKNLMDGANNADYVRFVSNTTGKGKAEFINKLLIKGFTLNLRASSFTKLTINMTSFYDPTVKEVITFEGKTVLFNGRSQPLAKEWQGKDMLSIFYNENTSSLSIGGTEFDYTPRFKGDAFLLSLEAEGLKTSDYIDISNVGNQPFRSFTTKDRIVPMTSAKFPNKIAYIGEKATISRLNIADVLTPTSEVSVTLNAQKTVKIGGKPTTIAIKDVKTGKELVGITDFSQDYEFEFDTYGNYVISYEIKDGAGNKMNGGYKSLTSVLDLEAPVITTSSLKKHTIKAGQEADLLNIEATDNITDDADIEIYHIIYDSKGRCVAAVENGNKINIATKGTYKVYVTAQDEEGNYGYAEYTLIVQ